MEVIAEKKVSFTHLFAVNIELHVSSTPFASIIGDVF